jgi:hypothetical protein
MITASPKPKQSIFRCRPVTTGRGAVQTHALRVQIVYPHQALIQCSLEPLSTQIIAQRIQDTFQAVIALVQRTHRPSSTTSQYLQALLSLVFNMIEPMIAKGEDVRQPHHTRPAETNPLPVAVAMGREVFIL